MRHIKFIFRTLLVLSIFTFSCSSDDGNGNDIPGKDADKTALEASIETADDLIENTNEGTSEGDYQVGSKAELEVTLNLAKTVYENPSATQSQVDNTVTQLDDAIEVYKSKIIKPINPEALVAHWMFDEGQGDIINDETGNHHGQMKQGAVENGAGKVEWVADRHGEANKALKFADGANVEVPFSTSLNPQNITISMWLKADEIFDGNYMISLNRWNGYKFNLQSTNKLMFTARASHEGENPIYDRDNDSPELLVDEWYHAAVTFGDGNMIFYLNGTMVKEWNDTPGIIDNVEEQYNFIIGQSLPTSVIDAEEEEWGPFNYFKGSMDDIRIYNEILSGTQINSIYEMEK
ncbi:LamG-like jellyroll fold domain-containing protein [Aureibacter tunicatorum]|uniref:LamG-like jellyroll fold domain-containing protein n=1 Tax=Aureibacter tunicatorum TaxID=866807 RepID=A0AAE3XT49_9BACT|nr:LamG-like jellyroll fold domain-containing protein [Aureibacter tunicatorum]MDR6241530.1 hypothetical protein [Aureibacter tunicatorum]BDD07012.1 hypothetical protein AUTU_44950 [Aureibacter tunicatorum]